VEAIVGEGAGGGLADPAAGSCDDGASPIHEPIVSSPDHAALRGTGNMEGTRMVAASEER
jgi:hypothetical protein